MSKSLALFVCDTPVPAVLSAEGDYLAIFTNLLRSSLSAEVEFTLDPYDVVHKKEYPSEGMMYDGIIITEAAASANDNLEWINMLISYIASLANDKSHVKIFGICFGHQIVARALGGETCLLTEGVVTSLCVPNDGKLEVGITKLDLTDLGKEVFGVPSLNLQQMHRDHVPVLPPGFHLLGSTSITYNQIMARFSPANDSRQLTDINVLTMQGHPEFTESIVNAMMDARLVPGVLNTQVVEEAKKRAGWRNDGVSVVGKAIWGVSGVS